MSNDDLVLELIQRWDDLHRQGSPTTPEKLCADHPELLVAVRDGVRALRALDPYLETFDVAPTRPDPRTADAANVPSAATFAGERFRPVRFHRRGGQGEVFLAHDE